MDSKKSITLFLSIGSSQTFLSLNSEQIVEHACEEIKKLEYISKNPENLKSTFQVSNFVKSHPWGGVAQNIFVNAVCRLEISTQKYPENSEENFLDILQSIEKKFGRVRNKNSQHWADRTLDIDIIFWGNSKISRPRLQIPHPFTWERDFVFEPLSEICTKEELQHLRIIGEL